MRHFLTLLICFSSSFSPVKAQITPTIPNDRDSLERYILTCRSTERTNDTYYLALKKISKLLLLEDRKAAVNYLIEAQTIANNKKDTIEIASISYLLGEVYRHWGYYYYAAENFQRSYMLSEKIGRRHLAGFDLVSIGNVYFDLKKFTEADMYYRRALQTFDSKYEMGGSVVALNNIALVFQEIGKLDSALFYFKEGLDLRVAQKNTQLIAHSHWYIATIYLDMNEPEKALSWAMRSWDTLNVYLQKRQLMTDLTHIPLALQYHIGAAYEKLDKIDSATYYWEKAIAMGKESPQLTSYFLASYRSLAALKERIGKRKEAEKLLFEAVDYATISRFSEEYEKALLQIADFLEKEGKYALAAGYLREYQAILKNKALGASNQMLNFHVLFETYEQQKTMHEQELLLQRERLIGKQQKQLGWLYLFGFSGALLGLLFVLRLYRRISRINNTLAQRNSAIEAQKNIIESNAQELLQLNETKDLLFSIIAHDLRAPFNTLTNFSKLMQSYIQNNQWQDLKNSFHVLEESSQKAYWTFENLLGWVQSQTGKLKAEIRVIDVIPLLEEVLGFLSSMSHLKHLQIEKNIEVSLVVADAYMLETVFRNLITNAIKYSKEGGTIKIEIQSQGELVHIRISDNGIGMSPDALKNLFNAQKLKASSQSISGLGLIICKNFVDTMGGTIDVSSERDMGTSFTITLPAGGSAEHPLQHTSIKTETTIEQPIQQNNSLLKSKLQAFLPSLRALSVYEASEVKEVIQKIYQISNSEKEIEDWLHNMNQALYLADEEAYEKLLDILQ